MENKQAKWSSNFAFILAAIGSAVGLGNIWRFPYIMGQNGGAVFLFVYLVLIATICFIPLCCELFIGKTSEKESVGAYSEINPKLEIFGWSNVVVSFLISAFYFVVGGWILNYIYQGIINPKISDYSLYFTKFSEQTVTPCVLTLIFLLMCSFFVARGVNKGIEIANKIMMPIFALILLFLVFVSLNLPDANLGLEFMFKPDFSKLSTDMFLMALGQALFTLSIGMGAMLTYGSYMKKEDNIIKSAYTIAAADTSFALLSGIVIFPAVFSFGLQPNSGAGLVFITLPKIFSQIPAGNVIATLFFVLLLFAALTSGISMVEVFVSSLIAKFKLSRLKSSIIATIVIFLISIPASLSFGVLSGFKIFDKTFFEFLDFTSSNILLPLNTMIVCIIGGWFLKIKNEGLFKNEVVYKIFNFTLKFVLPLILLFLIISGLK